MKAQEYIYYIVGFNAIMIVLQATGILKTHYSLQDYTATFSLAVILGLFGSLIGASLIAYLLPGKTSTEKSVMYGFLSTLLVGFFNTAFVPFDSICAGIPVAPLLLGIVKIFIAIVILFWVFQMIFGGGESYQ